MVVVIVSRKELEWTEIPGGVGKEEIYNLHGHHQNDFALRWAAEYSVSLVSHILKREES